VGSETGMNSQASPSNVNAAPLRSCAFLGSGNASNSAREKW
jgi:hypothetical protein